MSKQEILGHLIDSAQNNIQRFIRGQYETEPALVYDQDQWVAYNDYQQAEAGQLIQLWELLNRQIIRIWEHMPSENLSRQCRIRNSLFTIEYLMDDYIIHLKHHLIQINENYID